MTTAGALHVDFPAGLFGFPECRAFALQPAPRAGLYWLQSLEYPALGFLLADPFVYFEDYQVDVSPGDTGALGAAEPADIAVLVTVTLPAEKNGMSTVNLQGPLLIDVTRRVARQIVVNHPVYGVRQPLPELSVAA